MSIQGWKEALWEMNPIHLLWSVILAKYLINKHRLDLGIPHLPSHSTRLHLWLMLPCKMLFCFLRFKFQKPRALFPEGC